MKSGAEPVALWAWPLAILVLALFVLGANPFGAATLFRDREFDTYQILKPRPYEDPASRAGLPVRTLLIDQASIARFGSWPWSRTILAKLTGELKDAGVSLVVFALPLDTPDNATAFLSSLPQDEQNPALKTLLAKVHAPDDLLARAMASTHSVTGFTLSQTPEGSPPLLKGRVDLEGEPPALSGLTRFSDGTGAIPVLATASSGTGALNLMPDGDGVLRKVPFALENGGQLVPSLDAEAVRLANAASGIVLHAQTSGVLPGMGHPIVVSARVGLIDVPLTPTAALRVYFTAGASRGLSAAELDGGTLAATNLRNAIVYIAPPGPLLATPAGLRSRADIHAEAMENILLGTALARPNALGAEILFTLFGSLLIVFLFLRSGIVWAGATALVLVLGALGFSWSLFDNARLLVDGIGPAFTLTLVFLSGAAARAMELAQSRDTLRRAFAEALPPSVLESVARNPGLLNLDGETATVTYLSCHVRDFARLAASFLDDPQGFTRLMRRVTGPLLDEVTKHGGTIDHVASDGFSAFWNAPLKDPEHAIHACDAANGMTEALARVNDEIARERRVDGTAIDAIEIGIGISTGQAVVGGFGTRSRTGYSVSGDPVLMAEKIRGLSQQYGPAVILSEDTRVEAARGFAFLEVDYIAAGPRDEPVKLYALLGSPVVRASPKFRALSTFHDHIFSSIRSQQWGKARELIEQCRKLSGASQKLYDLHLNRIRYFQESPPGADWDGAFRTVVK